MVASQITPFTIEAFGEQAKVMPVHKAIAARFNLFMFLFLIEVVQEDCNTFQRFLRLVLDLDGKLDLSLGYATQIVKVCSLAIRRILCPVNTGCPNFILSMP